MTNLQTSVQVISPVDGQPSDCISNLSKLCAFLSNVPAAEQLHAEDTRPQRKRRRLSRFSPIPSAQVELQNTVILATIDVHLVRNAAIETSELCSLWSLAICASVNQ